MQQVFRLRCVMYRSSAFYDAVISLTRSHNKDPKCLPFAAQCAVITSILIKLIQCEC